MANTVALDFNQGGVPSNPTYNLVVDFSIDTYATGGVDMAALLNALTEFKATKLPTAGVFAGFVNLDPNATASAYTAEYDAPNNKLVLKKVDAGALVEETAGAITAVTGKLTVLLR